MALAFIRKRAPFKPTDITGCRLWLDGNDPSATGILPSDTSVVSTWVDKSGLGNNASQVNSPTYALSQKAVYFTGSSQYFTLPDGTFPTGNSSYSYFMITTFTNLGPNWSGVLGGGGYGATSADTIAFRTNGAGGGFQHYWWGNDLASSYTFATNQIVSIEGQYTSGGIRNLTQNFTNVTSGTPGTHYQAATNNTIGRTWSVGNEYMKGYIHEIICYSNALTTTEQQQLQGYLAQKWNLKANLPQGHPGLKGIITPSLPVNLFIRYEYPTTFTPTQITGCALWLDAADATTVTGTTNVTAVRDKSPNGVVLSNATGYSYPNNSFNGTYPSFYCANGYSTGSSATLGYNAAFALTMPFSMFFVGIQTNTGTYGDLCDAAPASAGANRIYTLTSGLAFESRIGTGATSVTQNNFIFNAAYTAGASASVAWLNGVSYVTGTVAQFTCSGITVANRFSLTESFPGHICEVIAYNTSLTQAQRQQVEGYLAAKWGLQANLGVSHPYKSVSPSITNPIGVSRPATLPARSIAIYATARPLVYVSTNILLNLDTTTYTSGSTWTATVGNNYIVTGTVTTTTTPGGSTALVFDGSSYAQDQTGITSTTMYSYTLDIWFYAAANVSGCIVGEQGSVGLPSIWNVILINIESNTINIGFWNGNVYKLSLGSYTANTWTHVSCTYDYSTSTLVGYVNGAYVATGTSTKQWPMTMYISLAANANPNPKFTGRIGPFKLYSAVLNATQVSQNYTGIRSRFI